MTTRSLASALQVLNIFDCITTLWVFALVGNIEANPLMSWLLLLHPVAFVAVKLVGVTWLSELLASQGRKAWLGALCVPMAGAVAMNCWILVHV